MSETIDQIMRLKAALERAPDASDSEEEDYIVAHTNRGHKLERGARFVSARTLNVPIPPSQEPDPEFSNDPDFQIDVEHILQPISDPAEVPNNPVIARIFKSPYLQQLSDELLDRLVEERATLAKLAKLLESTLGDDDAQAMPQIMARVGYINPYPSPAPSGSGAGANAVENGELVVEAVRNEDPAAFFELPDLQIDSNLGLSAKEAAELRERLQVAHQRLDEYVRCINQIRSGLTTATRLRRNILNWCREINGEDYVKIDLDEQNCGDNAGLGEKPAKDYNHVATGPQPGA